MKGHIFRSNEWEIIKWVNVKVVREYKDLDGYKIIFASDATCQQ